jgi:hypothetical protein
MLKKIDGLKCATRLEQTQRTAGIRTSRPTGGASPVGVGADSRTITPLTSSCEALWFRAGEIPAIFSVPLCTDVRVLTSLTVGLFSRFTLRGALVA